MINRSNPYGEYTADRIRSAGMLALLFLVLAFSATSRVEAQLWDRLTNPTSQVPIAHPPQIVIKDLQKIALREFGGEFGPELTDRFFAALTETGTLEVVDRSNVDAIMAEQGFQMGGSVTPDSAVKLGQMLGAAAMFTGRITRCTVERSPVLNAGQVSQYSDGQRYMVTKYVRKTTARMTASVQLVDLTTGRTHAAKLIESTFELSNEALGGYPESPSEEDALTGMYQDAIEKMKRIILPWTEMVALVVYDDNRLGLMKSANEVRRGDFEAAVETMTAAIAEVSQKDEKYLSKGYYNLGIGLMYSDRADEAIGAFEKSLNLRRSEVAEEAMATAKKMVALQKEHERLEKSAVVFDATKNADKPAAKPASTMGNADVIAMASAGLSDDIIIAKIKRSKCAFDTSTDSLIELKKANVSDAVMLVIYEKAEG